MNDKNCNLELDLQIFQIGKLAFEAGISEIDACALIFGPICGNVTASAHIWEVSLPPAPKFEPKTLSVSVDLQ